jgi:hypothetical protein
MRGLLNKKKFSVSCVFLWNVEFDYFKGTLTLSRGGGFKETLF